VTTLARSSRVTAIALDAGAVSGTLEFISRFDRSRVKPNALSYAANEYNKSERSERTNRSLVSIREC
jgi:hypothetical protein